MLPTQITEIILDVEHNGHATIPVMEMTRTTEEALHQLSTIYGIWLPGCSINYIIAKALAVSIQMIWTYPVYKKFIFIPHNDTA